MRRIIEGADHGQSTMLPECVDDEVGESNPALAVEALVDELKLAMLGFNDVGPEFTARPGYHPWALLKLHIYSYLNRIQSSRRLEREARRNLEVISLLQRLPPGDLTLADLRRDTGAAIKKSARRSISRAGRWDC